MTDYRCTTLANGLRVAVAHMPYWQSVSVGVFAGAGSRHEAARSNGIAHFTEHMLFKGTEKRSAKRIVVDAESVGGSINAYTAEEHTCYHIKSPAGTMDKMTQLLADIYQHSKFQPKEIECERRVIEDEILMYRDQPSSHVDDLLSAATWKGHPLGKPILGSPKTLAAMMQDDFFAYVERAYGARSTVVAIAGPQPIDKMVAVIDKYFGKLHQGARLPSKRFKLSKPQTQPILADESRPIEQTQMTLGFRSHGRHDRRAPASALLSVLMGETMSSRLSQELRERRGYCYQVGTQRELYRDVGLFTIFTGFDPRYLKQTLEVIRRECQRLKDKPPSQRELNRAFQHEAGQHMMGMEETDTQMFWIGDCLISDDKDFHPDIHLEALRSVTPAAIQEAANDLFQPNKASIAMLGPDMAPNRPMVADLLHAL